MQIDRERVLRDLVELVRVPSVTGDESEARDAVAALMADAGLDVEVLDPQPGDFVGDPRWPGSEVTRDSLPIAVGRLRGNSQARLLLVAHLDVVPPGEESHWSTSPFEPEIRHGQLYGRGACDMKGGLVAGLEAMRAIAKSGQTPPAEIVLLCVPSEEDGGGGSFAAIRSGIHADAAIIAEPTRLDIVVAHAGAITFRLSLPGRAAHAASRLNGRSALEPLSMVVDALNQDEISRNTDVKHPLMGVLQLPYPTIIGKANGGSWASTVMDQIVIEGRYGVRLGESPTEAEESLRSVIRRVWDSDALLRESPLQLEVFGGKFASTEIPGDHWLPRSLQNRARDMTGRRPNIVGVPYGADMHLFVSNGIPTVLFGPGDIQHAHSSDERVPLEEVYECAAVLANWLMSFPSHLELDN